MSTLSGFNLLVWIADSDILSGWRGFRFALRGRTQAVHGAANPRHDGVWTGLASVSGLRRELGSPSSGTIVGPTVRVELARGDDADGLSARRVRDIRDQDYLVGRAVYFYLVGPGRPNPGEDTLLHVGQVGRGDVEITPTTVVISCRDRMEADDRRIPDRFFPDESPVQADARGNPIPVMLGDWGAESSDYWLAAVCVDTAAGYDERTLRARLCRPGARGIVSPGRRAVWLDRDGRPKRDETGYRDFAVNVIDPVTGVFELVGSEYARTERRWEDGDVIRVDRPRGDADADGRLITSPAGIVRHLLTDTANGLGLAPALVDAASFDAVEELGAAYGYRARGWIEDETTVQGVIARIGVEFGFKLVVTRGKYALVPLGLDPDAPAARRLASATLMDWREWNDRRGDGSDGLMIRYRRYPGDDRFTRAYAQSADAASGAGMSRLEAEWIYDDAGAEARVSHWSLTYAGLLRSVTVNLDYSALGIDLGEFVELDFGEGYGLYQVGAVSYDFDPPVGIEVELIAAHRPSAEGVWSAQPGEPVPEEFGRGLMPEGFDDATPAQRERLSFWTDDDGTNPDGEPGKIWGR